MEDFAKRYYECNPGLVDNPGIKKKKKKKKKKSDIKVIN
jgi:hypothetical protein